MSVLQILIKCMAILSNFPQSSIPFYFNILFNIKLNKTYSLTEIFLLNKWSRNYYYLSGLQSHQINSKISGIHPALLSVLFISFPIFG